MVVISIVTAFWNGLGHGLRSMRATAKNKIPLNEARRIPSHYYHAVVPPLKYENTMPPRNPKMPHCIYCILVVSNFGVYNSTKQQEVNY
jgi:hypothetical protein